MDIQNFLNGLSTKQLEDLLGFLSDGRGGGVEAKACDLLHAAHETLVERVFATDAEISNHGA